LCDKAAFIGISSARPRDDKSRDGAHQAVAAMALCENDCRYVCFEAKDRGGAGVAADSMPARFPDVSICYTAAFFRNPGRRFLGGLFSPKSEGLAKFSAAMMRRIVRQDSAAAQHRVLRHVRPVVALRARARQRPSGGLHE
jgi:hypothetical protein